MFDVDLAPVMEFKSAVLADQGAKSLVHIDRPSRYLRALAALPSARLCPTPARMRSLSAVSLSLSPSSMSIARVLLP